MEWSKNDWRNVAKTWVQSIGWLFAWSSMIISLSLFTDLCSNSALSLHRIYGKTNIWMNKNTFFPVWWYIIVNFASIYEFFSTGNYTEKCVCYWYLTTMKMFFGALLNNNVPWEENDLKHPAGRALSSDWSVKFYNGCL